ncbi:hypothetical protein Hte_001062 [Hypoxylon texense]
MASSKPPNRFKLPVGTCHSVGIELEFLVAYLPTGIKDPFESHAASLPPLLRLDSGGWDVRVEAMRHIRKTLREFGIHVANPLPPLRKDVPRRLQNRNMWEVGLDESLHEEVYEGFGWIPIEVRSPALWAGEEAYEEIRCVVNLLTYHYRLRVNPTCGFHVHVGNGRRFFPADSIKRLGGLLWAADPMLSRLHAPWRRVNRYCPSIRYLSKLACEGTVNMERWYREGPAKRDPPIDPIAVTEFSDTSLEEKEYGSKEACEYVAYLSSQAGPFMSFGEDLHDVTDYKEEDSKRRDVRKGGEEHGGPKEEEREEKNQEGEEVFPDGFNPYLDQSGVLMPLYQANKNDTDLRKSAKDLINRLIEEAIPSKDIPPEPHSLYRNLAWHRWDELEDGVIELLNDYCEDTFGHKDLRSLSTVQQINLMLDAQSTFLFGHPEVEELTIDQQTRLLERCCNYFEMGRSSFKRNPKTNRWELAWWEVGPIEFQPDAEKETNINAPYLLRKFENLANLMDMQGDHHSDGIEYVSRAEHDGALESMKDTEKMFDGLREYAESPPPDYKKDIADYTWYGRPKGMPSPITPQSDGSDFAPAAWVAAHGASPSDSEAGNSDAGGTGDDVPPPGPAPVPEVYEKLRPHDPNDLPAAYVDGVNRYTNMPDALWDRIGWIPSVLHPLPDPAASVRPEDYINFVPDPSVSTAEGVYAISRCASALAAATLLQGARPVRCNYNFDHYTEELLEDGFAEETSRNPRTIEFREAEGTLDAPWIVTWARICVGLVRFARRAPVANYLHVLGQVGAQENRDLARRAALAAAAAGGAETYEFEERDERARYDVCDLLEDMGLVAEAAFVRRREKTRMRDMLAEVNCKLPRRKD